jgi:hypothetical protein
MLSHYYYYYYYYHHHHHHHHYACIFSKSHSFGPFITVIILRTDLVTRLWHYAMTSDIFMLGIKVKLSLCLNRAPRRENVLRWRYSSTQS